MIYFKRKISDYKLNMEIKTPLCREHIGSIDEAEECAIDNEYIHTGYRINYNSSKLICKSLCRRHNETVNIWSHVFGIVLFLIFLGHTWASVDYDDAE